MNPQHSQQFLKKRKLLLALPALALPFLTLLFWAAGGGRATARVGDASKIQGLNTTLPGPQNDSPPGDKLSLYQRALKDSLDLQQQRQEDPYSRDGAVRPGEQDFTYSGDTSSEEASTATLTGGYDPNEEKVNRKLAAFRAALAAQPQMAPGEVDSYERYEQSDVSSAIDRAQAAMQQAGTSSLEAGDPEMQQLDGMLQKILDIQHPDQARQRMEQQSESHQGEVFPVSLTRKANIADLFGNGGRQPDTLLRHTGAFYESSGDNAAASDANKAVSAVVNETQTLVSGATIKMRLAEDIYVNGICIPKGNFVYAICSLDGERLKGDITAIRYTDRLFPVSLAIYDLDGIEGIKVPGAITRDAAKQGMQQATQSLDIYSMDQSLGAQAASAGIQTAKSLFGNKVKLVQATVRSGYPVLLMDKKKQNNQ